MFTKEVEFTWTSLGGKIYIATGTLNFEIIKSLDPNTSLTNEILKQKSKELFDKEEEILFFDINKKKLQSFQIMYFEQVY